MKIFYLKMKNFRQYLDAQIEFSTDPEKNFTVIRGSNGAGKTTILNAITWCLFGEEMHLSDTDSQKLPVVNEKFSHEMEPSHTQGVYVEIGLGQESLEYMISRSAQVYKKMDGSLNIAADTDPRVLYLIRGDWKTSDQPNYAIKSLLPKEISQFFLFDGEQLDRFFQSDSAERVKQGIVDVSQIDLLDTAYQHLHRVHNDLLKETPESNGEADEYKRQYEQAEQDIEEAETKLSNLKRDLEGVEKNIEEINKKLRESPQEEVRQLQAERDGLNEKITEYQQSVNGLIEDASRNLQAIGPTVYTHAAVRDALDKIQERIEVGDLPPVVRKPFFKELLDHEECVCGTPLTEGSGARRNVAQRMEAVLNVEDFMNKASEGRYKLENTLDALPGKIAQQQNIGQKIWQFEEAIKNAERRLKEISEKIGDDIDQEEIKVLEQQLQQFENEKTTLNRKIGMEQKTLADAINKREATLKKYHKALKHNEKQRDFLIRSEICADALTMLEKIRTELLTETREKIQQKTEDYFLNLIWKKATYNSVTIDDNYRLNVENIRGLPSLGTLSAGERQVLALAFTAALGTISGFDAPIVIDTPIGRISEEPRENIADALPNYLRDTQVTFLMTETEYTDNVRVRLLHRVGKEYDLKFDEDEAMTRVVPF